ncbi:lysozyme [Streptantibioticus silvisoli]|uniref:Lysozyme n=1 Tax=Streptantibioticus silvisoli TaxID=2705255 RepID=A0ABT6VXW3_9ACTN|nr:lysozyme [Streptantibioticus silvisoli]MDI5963328.1 lysozyme [Streptantibioticus silvisoli]
MSTTREIARETARHRSRTARLATAAGALLAVASAVLALPGTASAAPAALPTAHPVTHPAGQTAAQAAAAAKVTHPELDWLGSTVPAHDPGAALRPAAAVKPLDATVSGMDVSAYQGAVDWATAAANGGQFAYVKATEGTSYTNPDFSQQYNGSYNAGMIRGAYHFATPNTSGGAAQADYFVSNGGGWSADGKTLPPMLDIEYNPYGDECYDLSQADMVSWIAAFSNEVLARTGRYPTIYSTTDWWTTCTGNSSAFSATNPLFVADYNGTVGTLPAGWAAWTFWQYADSGTFPGDQDYFDGAIDRLQALALNQ